MINFSINSLSGEINGYSKSFMKDNGILEYKINPSKNGIQRIDFIFQDIESLNQFKEDFDL